MVDSAYLEGPCNVIASKEHPTLLWKAELRVGMGSQAPDCTIEGCIRGKSFADTHPTASTHRCAAARICDRVAVFYVVCLHMCTVMCILDVYTNLHTDAGLPSITIRSVHEHLHGNVDNRTC